MAFKIFASPITLAKAPAQFTRSMNLTMSQNHLWIFLLELPTSCFNESTLKKPFQNAIFLHTISNISIKLYRKAPGDRCGHQGSLLSDALVSVRDWEWGDPTPHPRLSQTILEEGGRNLRSSENSLGS